MIPESVLFKIGNVTVKPSNVVVKGVDSEDGFKADGEVTLDVGIDSQFKMFSVTFLVTAKPIPVLLGMNVIQEFKLFDISNGASLHIQPSDGYPVYKIQLIDPATVLKLTQQVPETKPMVKPAMNASPDLKFTWLKTMKGVQLNHPNKTEVDDIVKILFEYEQAIGSEHEKLGEFPKPVTIRTKPNSERAIIGNHVPQALRGAVDDEIARMEKIGVISKCKDPKGWNSPVFAVKKPNGSIRVVANFKNSLNKSLAEVDPYPTPSTTNIFTDIGSGNKYFCTADLRSGYWQFRLDEESKPKTAFTWNGDTYHYNVLPFGMTDSGALFSRNVHEAVSVLGNDGYLRYVDDNLIYATDFKVFKDRLAKFLQTLITNGLKLNASKCSFISAQARFLGRIITSNGIEADKDYVQALIDIPAPTTRKELLSFLGRIVWLKSYLETCVGEKIGTQCFSALIHEMTRLSSSKVAFEWTPLAAKQFSKVKKKLATPPVIAFPDWSKDFILITDASDIALGGVLMQYHDGGAQKIVATCSHKFSDTERRWSTIERECFALVFSVRKFNYFLEGRQFFVKTDHKPLIFINDREYQNGKIVRWQRELQQYTFTICHIAGKDNGIADILSRPNGHSSHNGPAVDDGNVGAVYEADGGKIQFYVPPWCMNQSDPDVMILKKVSTTVAKVLSASVTCESASQEKLQISLDQMDDGTLRKIKDHLVDKRNGKPVGDLEEILDGVDEVQYKKYAKDMKLGPGTDAVYIMNHGQPRIIIPRKLISSYLYAAHDASGHHGISRMRHYMAHFYWPGKDSDITAYVNSCQTCARRKGNYGHNDKPDIGHCPRGTRPFSSLTIDFVGPLQNSNGKQYICTILDNFSRFFAGFASRTDSATDASKALFKFMTQHRVTPEIIGSDRGSHFTGNVFQETLRMFGIKHNLHVAWRPQSSGNLERNHRVLKNSLFAVCSETNAKWDTCLDLVISNMNAMVNSATKFSPHFVIYGRHPTLFMPVPTTEITASSALSYGMAISNQNQIVQKLVTLAAEEADTALENRYNVGKCNSSLKPGDKVLLYRPNSSEAKRTKMPWLDGYQVVKSNGLVIKLKHKSGQMDWCHRHHIRLLQQRPQHLLDDLYMYVPEPSQNLPHSIKQPTPPSVPVMTPTPATNPSHPNLSFGGDDQQSRGNVRPHREKKKPKRLIETMDPKSKTYFQSNTEKLKSKDSSIIEMMELMFMAPEVNLSDGLTNVSASVSTHNGCTSGTSDNVDAISDATVDVESDTNDAVTNETSSNVECKVKNDDFEEDSLDDDNGATGTISDDIESIHSSEIEKSSLNDTENVERFADILETSSSSTTRTPSPPSPEMTCPTAPHKKKTQNLNEWVKVPSNIIHVPLEKILTTEQLTEIRNQTVLYQIKSMKDLNCDELQAVQNHYKINLDLKWNANDKLDCIMKKRKLADSIRKQETDVKVHGLDTTTAKTYPIISVPYKYDANGDDVSQMEVRAMDWFQLTTYCINNNVKLQKEDLVSRDSILNVISKSSVI